MRGASTILLLVIFCSTVPPICAAEDFSGTPEPTPTPSGMPGPALEILQPAPWPAETFSPPTSPPEPTPTPAAETVPTSGPPSRTPTPAATPPFGDIPEPDDPELCPEEAEYVSAETDLDDDSIAGYAAFLRALENPEEAGLGDAGSANAASLALSPRRPTPATIALCNTLRSRMQNVRDELKDLKKGISIREALLPEIRGELMALLERANRGIPIAEEAFEMKIHQITAIYCELKKLTAKSERKKGALSNLQMRFATNACEASPEL